jgi:hypothetical protein
MLHGVTVYFLKVLGVLGMCFCWAPVFFPKITVSWKGGNRWERDGYAGATGRPEPARLTKRQIWTFLCLADALFLAGSLYAVIRDSYSPLQNGNQRILHYMARGYLAASCIAAVVLYRVRRRTNVSEQ